MKSISSQLAPISAFFILVVSLGSHMTWAAEPVQNALSLSDAEQKFRTHSRELKAAKRELEGYQADTLSAGQLPNPQLSMGVSSFNLNRRQGNTNPDGSNSLANKTLDSDIQLSQLVERGNKRQLRMAAAQDAVKASRFNLSDALRQQKLQLKESYYDLLLAQELERIQSNNIALYQKTLDAAELRFKAGDIASTDVARIRIDALKAMNDARQAASEREKAQADLAYLIGEEDNAASLLASDAWPDPAAAGSEAPALSGAFSAAAPSSDRDLSVPDLSMLDQRADIQAAEARTQQAMQNRQLAEALKTRDLTVAVQYQHFPGQQPGAGDDTIGAAISIPLFVNYQYQGEIARSEVELTASMEAREQALAAAKGEISRARSNLQAASDKLQRFDQQMLAESKKSADAAEFAYQHGAVGVTDLLDARRVQRALELDAASVRADYAKALAAWQAATSTELDQ